MKIGIIGALDEEIFHYRNEMELLSEEVKAGITFYSGMINGFSVVICKCGVGKVNASVCTEILIGQINRHPVQGMLVHGRDSVPLDLHS